MRTLKLILLSLTLFLSQGGYSSPQPYQPQPPIQTWVLPIYDPVDQGEKAVIGDINFVTEDGKRGEITCKDGIETSTFWYEDGQISYKSIYKYGIDTPPRCDDVQKETDLILLHPIGMNRKDGIETRTSWYENGQIMLEENWKDNIPDGDWTFWFENGQIGSEGNFKDGTGTFLQLHKNNQKSKEVILKDGNLKQTEWYENGQKKFEENYNYGKLDGRLTWWYENGQINQEITYKDGIVKTTTWDENGHISSKSIQNNYGDCISGDC